MAVSYQMTLSVDTVQTSRSLFSSSMQWLDHVPRPHTAFTSMQYGVGTGEGISPALDGVSIRCVRMTGMEADPEQYDSPTLDFDFLVDVEQPHSHSGGGITVPDDVGVGCMPSSIEVSFRYEGKDYNCVLLPIGGAA